MRKEPYPLKVFIKAEPKLTMNKRITPKQTVQLFVRKRERHTIQRSVSMAASTRHYARSNHRYLSGDREPPILPDSIFELDESDVWNVTSSPEFRKPVPTSRISNNSPVPVVGGTASSLPVNVPDWSKILKQDSGQNRRRVSDFDEFEYGGDGGGGGNRIPPHEFLAKQLARTRIASFSVHEGIGRTLKGRDLSRVRNAVWEKIGFQD